MFDYTAIVERLYEYQYEYLNAWEKDFIKNIYNECVLECVPLSEKRKEKILQINRRVLKG